MVITNADKDPADSKVIIFRQFISVEGFTASLDTVIHIAIDTITKMKIPSLDTLDTSIINNNTLYTKLEKIKFHDERNLSFT
jgi:hypothetical protein